MRIRHSKYPFREPRRKDPRRRYLAAQRAIERLKQKDGILAATKTYESAGERVRRFESAAAHGMRRERQERARAWREARRVLFALPQAERETALERWNALQYPGEPGTFQRFLEKREWARPPARWDLSWAIAPPSLPERKIHHYTLGLYI